MTETRKRRIIKTVTKLIAAERKEAVATALSLIDRIANEAATKEPRLGGVAEEIKRLTSQFRLGYATKESPAELLAARERFEDCLDESIYAAFIADFRTEGDA